MAGARELLDEALGVRALVDVLQIGGVDLVTERGYDQPCRPTSCW